MNIHLYMLCYRFEALVASHLEPEAFGRYMAVGTQKNTRGNVLFFEIDRNALRSDYFHLDDIEQRCVPHPDGSPKRSKYISIYRVLEHLDLNAFGKLYLVTADGRVLALDSSEYKTQEERGVNLFDELCPVSPMVVSALAPSLFASFLTNPKNPISVPRIFFADMLLDRDETGRLAGYLPYADPIHIIDCVKELEQGSGKPSKTVSRSPRVHGFFRTIRRGFFIGDQTGVKYYPFPERRELEVSHAKWWRSASESLS
jgi:hypothetical protein